MNPFYLLGWILVLVFGSIALLFVGRILVVVVALFVATYKDFRDARLYRRANAGKVTCQDIQGVSCNQKARRRTPRGYYCEEHWRRNKGSGIVSFAFILDHAKPQEDK